MEYTEKSSLLRNTTTDRKPTSSFSSSDGATEGIPSKTTSTVPTTKVSVIAVALLCFSCVAGGPFGIEAAVQAAGALPTIVGLGLAGK